MDVRGIKCGVFFFILILVLMICCVHCRDIVDSGVELIFCG